MSRHGWFVKGIITAILVSPAPAFAQGVAPTRALVVVAGPGVARYEATSRYHGIKLLSPGISYHFPAGMTLSPYVRGGYTLGMAVGTANMIHLAAGLDQTLGNRLRFRYEVRDHTFPDVHVMEFVVGFVMRSR